MASDPGQLYAQLGQMTGLVGRSFSEGQNNRIAQDQARQGMQINQFKMDAARKAEQQEAQYQQDVQTWISQGATPGGLMALAARYPEKAEAIKKGWDVKDAAVRTADMGQLGSIYSALNSKRTDLALNQLRARRDAEKAAGVDTSEIDHYIEALASDDPAAVNTVKGWALAHLAAADSDKFAENFKVVGGERGSKVVMPGGALVNDEGKELYRAPFAPQIKSVGQGETLIETQPGGGGQSSGGGQYTGGWTPRSRNGGDNTDAAVDGKIAGAAQFLGVGPDDDISSLSPLKIAEAMALSEGGPGSLADRNNNPGNIKGAGGEGGFRKFPTREAGLAAAAALAQRKLKAGQTTLRTMIEGLPSGGQSGTRIIAQGQPKPGYRILTPQEVPAGLDPNTVYQMSPDGQVTAVGGQKSAQLKTWPAPALAARSSNIAAVKNLDNALTLLDPSNRSAEAIAARNAVGFGTGFGGEYLTNWRDPKGTAFRALIGQIGGIIIKDTSGAAVSISEDERLKKWVPYVTDTPSTIKDKLNNLRRELTQRNQSMDETYTEDQGYRPFSQGGGGAVQGADPVRVRSLQEAQKLPPGTIYMTPNGKRFRR